MFIAIKAYRPLLRTKSSTWNATGIPERGDALLDAVAIGLPYVTLGKVASQLAISTNALAQYIGIPRSTLHRRMLAGGLNTKESDRLYRVVSVLSLSTELFDGNQDAASQWMCTPQRGLGGRRPIQLLQTFVGAEAVCDLIGRLEHSVLP